MEVNRLDEEELDYELRIRGYSGIGTDDVKRTLLRGLFKMGENDLETFVLLDAEEEIEVCSKKIRELLNVIREVEGDRRSESYRIADTKLSHLLGRIDRITTKDPKLLKTRSVLLKTILHLMQDMEEKVRSFGSTNRENGDSYNITPGKMRYVRLLKDLKKFEVVENFLQLNNRIFIVFSDQNANLKK